ARSGPAGAADGSAGAGPAAPGGGSARSPERQTAPRGRCGPAGRESGSRTPPLRGCLQRNPERGVVGAGSPAALRVVLAQLPVQVPADPPDPLVRDGAL